MNGPNLDLFLVQGGRGDRRSEATILVLKTGKKHIASTTDTEICMASDRVQPLAHRCESGGTSVEFCEDSKAEPFSEERTIRSGSPACTGVALDEDEIATVHHCLPYFPGAGGEDPREDALLVVGHTKDNVSGDTICFPRDTVMEVVERTRSDGNGDHDIIAYRVKPYGSEAGAKLSAPKLCDTAKSGPVEVRGHPFGLPQTKTTDGKLTVGADGKLGCRVDSFKGNSGSPVFHTRGDCVVGLLSTAHSGDLRVNGNCCDIQRGNYVETVTAL